MIEHSSKGGNLTSKNKCCAIDEGNSLKEISSNICLCIKKEGNTKMRTNLYILLTCNK